jgi:type VI secretion system protein ImpJ
MSWHNRVIWSEGTFLRPQHFQQQDRCFDQLVRTALGLSRAYAWGFRSLEIDRALLQTGKIAVMRCRGVFSDGTLFSVPEEQDPPPVLDVAADAADRIVYLGAPIERSALAADELAAASDGLTRLVKREIEVYDTAEDSLGSRAAIEIGRMPLRLLLQGEALAGYHTIPMLRIAEVSNDHKVLLHESFIPTCTDHRASAQLTEFLAELQGLLRQRAESQAEFVSASGRGSVAEVTDFLLLQLMNRLEPVITHLCDSGGLHPEDLYRLFLAIAGELATFTTEARRPEPLPRYDHENLILSFGPVEDAIRRSLQWMREKTAIAIPIEELGYGIRRAVINDRPLLETASFVLEVSADLDADRLMKAFRDHSKVAPQQMIRELVMQALPGIPPRPRPNAPRQLPYHANAVYFEIDTGHQLWAAVVQSGLLTLHVADASFPNLAMTLWALKR